jgi:hypothetical protein
MPLFRQLQFIVHPDNLVSLLHTYNMEGNYKLDTNEICYYEGRMN